MGFELFLQSKLKEFYNSFEVDSVPQIDSREFGIGEFGKKISNRHLSFKNKQELNSFLREKAPFYISYSNAKYEFPAARPMEKKIFIGGDLIYEFDADDIKTECKLTHDSWKCKSCNANGKGNIEKCPECGMGVKVEEWVCKECINETKTQTKKLLKILENDFGFSNGIFINFSGSKGFHIHIRGEEVQHLSKAGRLELLDYITGTNIDFESMGFKYNKTVYFAPKKEKARGWAKKLLNESEKFLESDAITIASNTSQQGYNVTKSMAEKLLKEKHSIINGMDRGLLKSVQGVNGEKFWSSTLSFIVDEQKLDVDRQTSIDINKIIRVPNTLHGSTGLQAKELSVEELNNFDALKETVVLGSEEVKVNATSPQFYLNAKNWGPYNNTEISLPVYAAFYLLARGNAILMEGN